MYKYIGILLIAPAVFANTDPSSDLDFDGVPDVLDECPATLITDLVNIQGCTIESLVSPHSFNISFGTSFSQLNTNSNNKTDTQTQSLSAGYNYKNYSLQASTSYSSSKSNSLNDNGMGDTTLSAGYLHYITPNLGARFGAGVVIPTYKTSLNNNHTDYIASLNISYSMDRFNVFAGYNFKKSNDDDVPNVFTYQNTHGFSAGVGYSAASKLYISGTYSKADNSVQTSEDTESVSIAGSYSIDENWSANASYIHGLSKSTSDHNVSFNIGYRF